MKVLHILVLIFGLFVVIGYGQSVYESTSTTRLRGVVSDSDKPAKDAVVFAIDNSGKKYSVKTDSKGRYELRLPIGEYQIKAFIPTGFSVEISSEPSNLFVKKIHKIKRDFVLISRGCG